jgi:glycosyltransferase involved in cell wall biosynthesis
MTRGGALLPPGATGRAPSISVILPVHNGEPHLADAVASIQRQTLADFELLAIDDRSTDGSAAFLQLAASRDPRIRVVASRGRGLVEALNLGLSLARGDLVARMDADDISMPIRFERQAKLLNDSAAIAVVGSALTLIDDAGRAVGEVDYPTGSTQIEAALARMDCALAHSSVMARRSVLVSIGGYREAFRHAEDYDLWLRVAEHHRIENLPERLMCYRHHGASVSQRHGYEQRLATHVALLCARERRAGHPDPMSGRSSLSFADLSRFEEGQRAMVARLMLESFRPRRRPAITWLPAPLRALLRRLLRDRPRLEAALRRLLRRVLDRR